MPRPEPQDQKLKIIKNQLIFWEILWETSYLFYHPSNSTVRATSNNSIAAAHPSPSPINLLLKRIQLASREHAREKEHRHSSKDHLWHIQTRLHLQTTSNTSTMSLIDSPASSFPNQGQTHLYP